MNPLRVWRVYTIRQIIIFYNYASRALWKDREFAAALKGINLGPEPVWILDGPRFDPVQKAYEDIERLKAKDRARGKKRKVSRQSVITGQ